MKDIVLSLILGTVLGIILGIGYYDGVIAREYKERISQLSSALTRAGKEINEKDNDLETLVVYIDSLLKQQKHIEQLRSKNNL